MGRGSSEPILCYRTAAISPGRICSKYSKDFTEERREGKEKISLSLSLSPSLSLPLRAFASTSTSVLSVSLPSLLLLSSCSACLISTSLQHADRRKQFTASLRGFKYFRDLGRITSCDFRIVTRIPGSPQSAVVVAVSDSMVRLDMCWAIINRGKKSVALVCILGICSVSLPLTGCSRNFFLQRLCQRSLNSTLSRHKTLLTCTSS